METGNNTFQTGILVDQLANHSADQCHLALEVSPGKISGIVWNTKDNSPVLQFRFSESSDTQAIERFEKWFDERLKDYGLFQKASLSIASSGFTPVPNDIYNSDDLDSLIIGNFKTRPGETLRSDRMEQIDAHMVYAAPMDKIQGLIKRIPNAKIMHSSTILAEALLTQRDKEMICVRLFNDLMLVCAIKDEKLQLASAFEYKEVTDVIYNIRFVMDTVRTEGQKCPITVDGVADQMAAVEKELPKFFDVRSNHLQTDLSKKFKEETSIRSLANHIFCA